MPRRWAAFKRAGAIGLATIPGGRGLNGVGELGILPTTAGAEMAQPVREMEPLPVEMGGAAVHKPPSR